MYKRFFILGMAAGIAGVIGLSCGIFMMTEWQQMANVGYTSQSAGLTLANVLVLSIIVTGLAVSCLGAALSAWAYGKGKDRRPG